MHLITCEMFKRVVLLNCKREVWAGAISKRFHRVWAKYLKRHVYGCWWSNAPPVDYLMCIKRWVCWLLHSNFHNWQQLTSNNPSVQSAAKLERCLARSILETRVNWSGQIILTRFHPGVTRGVPGTNESCFSSTPCYCLSRNPLLPRPRRFWDPGHPYSIITLEQVMYLFY